MHSAMIEDTLTAAMIPTRTVVGIPPPPLPPLDDATAIVGAEVVGKNDGENVGICVVGYVVGVAVVGMAVGVAVGDVVGMGVGCGVTMHESILEVVGIYLESCSFGQVCGGHGGK